VRTSARQIASGLYAWCVDRSPNSLRQSALSLYLVIHFIELMPWAPRVWSNQGTLPNAYELPAYHRWSPNPLMHWDSPLATQVFLGMMAALSLAFGLMTPMYRCGPGWQRGYLTCALGAALAYGWACLFQRNLFINNPGLPYVGLLLVAHALGLMSHATCESPSDARRIVFWALAVGYTVSGVDKYRNSPLWYDGEALSVLLDNPLARLGPARDVLLWLRPSGVLSLLTWTSLAMEMAYAPVQLLLHYWCMALVPGALQSLPGSWPRELPDASILQYVERAYALAMVGMHLGILLVINFTDLTVGMLIVHLYCWF
jgi:hypothetical protein